MTPSGFPEGWDEAPGELRQAFKILKDAGFAPPEIEFFHERARLRAGAEAATEISEKQRLQRALSDIEQKISLRLEALRVNALL